MEAQYGIGLQHKFMQGEAALLAVTRAYRTEFNDAVHVLSGTIPIDILIEERCKLFELAHGHKIPCETRRYCRITTMTELKT
ncbi:hypothetical protein PR048_004001 [Dryococelus australis]|uniref:Uncharacterized protein n=1 Tax=Dryococelus australis TaxID=614101 RepID=A0ABQ9I680_9NEOP|nr:hypothetical protein PR048_004001 [Dryococelus australis]